MYGRDYRGRRTVGEMGEWRGGTWVWHGDRSEPLNRYGYGYDFDLHPGYDWRRRMHRYDVWGGYTAQRSHYGGYHGGFALGPRPPYDREVRSRRRGG